MARANTIALDPAYVEPWTGEPNPEPHQALKPKPCRCEIPAMDTDEDGDRRCVKCGRAEVVE